MYSPFTGVHRDEYARGRGFTLIEVLVVIAIITLLAAILFPVFGSAREKARQSTCMNNQRQIATAILMYAQDNDELLPSADIAWKVCALSGQVLQCPTAGVNVANAYVYNSTFAGMPMGNILTPDQDVLVADGQHTGGTGIATTYDNVAYTATDFSVRHAGKLIAAFLDGHVMMGNAASINNGEQFVALGNFTVNVSWVSSWPTDNPLYMNFCPNSGSTANSAVYLSSGMNGASCLSIPDASGASTYLYRTTSGYSFSMTPSYTYGMVFATTTTFALNDLLEINAGFASNSLQMTAAGNIVATAQYYDSVSYTQYPSMTGQSGSLTTAKAYNDGSPHLIVVTMGTTGESLYLDGTLVAAATKPTKYYGTRTGCTMAFGRDGRPHLIGAIFCYDQVMSGDTLSLLTTKLKSTFSIP